MVKKEYGRRSITKTTLLASAARTATTNSSAVDFDNSAEGNILVDVTAVSGTTPTLDITFQVSSDDGTTWFAHSSLSQISATGQYRLGVTNFGDFIRLNCVIAGATPSFTFSAVAQMKT